MLTMSACAQTIVDVNKGLTKFCEIYDGVRILCELSVLNKSALHIAKQAWDFSPHEGIRATFCVEQCIQDAPDVSYYTRAAVGYAILQVTFVDCQKPFRLPKAKVNPDLMPDLLHPNELGEPPAWRHAVPWTSVGFCMPGMATPDLLAFKCSPTVKSGG